MIELYRPVSRGCVGDAWAPLAPAYVARARAARDKLAARLRGQPWFRGVGLTGMRDRSTGRLRGILLLVLVQGHPDRRKVLREIDGFGVLTEVVGDIVAQGMVGDAIDDEILPRLAEYASIAADHVANRLTERAPELLDQIAQNPAVQEKAKKAAEPLFLWLAVGGLVVTFLGSSLAEAFVHALRGRNAGPRVRPRR